MAGAQGIIFRARRPTACEPRVIVGQKFLRLPQDLPREWQYLLRWTYA
jgi:hypothetical protein